MNLEQIDTSTTAGKAEVMRLAAEGRRVAYSAKSSPAWIECLGDQVYWNWVAVDFAIISDPVGPEELWAVQFSGHISSFDGRCFAERIAKSKGGTVVRYIREDLAGEVK